MAELRDDTGFFERLGKAMTRTSPRRPAPTLDGVRYLLMALEECGGLRAVPYERLCDILVQELQLYHPEGDGDPASALKKLIQRRAKKLGT